MTTNIQTHAQTHMNDLMKPQPKWQDWSIVLLGGILFISPWIFRTTLQTSSSWNAWIIGIGLGFLTWRTLLPPPGAYANQCEHEGHRMSWWQMVINSCKLSHIAKEEIVVAAWLLIAPSILGFAASGIAAWTAWLMGAFIMVLAVWKLRSLKGQ